MIPSAAGTYDIDLEALIPEGADRIIIAMHGFCGSKASRCITMLQKRALAADMGLVKFDWPAHGESNAEDEDLTVANCLQDLETVIDKIRGTWPMASLTAFATSFGGYIAMLYAADHPEAFDQIILRSPALRFGEVLREGILDDDACKDLEKQGWFLTGFDRKIRVTKAFVEETERIHLADPFPITAEPGDAKAIIIHGSADELVPHVHSVAFAQRNGWELHTVRGADHRYMGAGQLKEAVSFAMKRILAREQQS